MEIASALFRSLLSLAMLLINVTVFTLLGAMVSGARAEDVLVEKGRMLVEQNCARCHATGAEDVSPFAPAPPFRELGQRYPIADLEEALAEGILTGHPAMPEFAFEPDDIAGIIAYLQSIQVN
jgi:mono/diheme cytochrome c family protein